MNRKFNYYLNKDPIPLPDSVTGEPFLTELALSWSSQYPDDDEVRLQLTHMDSALTDIIYYCYWNKNDKS